MSSFLAQPYANTLPNTKTNFPPNDRVFQSDAPWVTNSGFLLPAGTGQNQGCPSSGVSNFNPFTGPSNDVLANIASDACVKICAVAPNSDACRKCSA